MSFVTNKFSRHTNSLINRVMRIFFLSVISLVVYLFLMKGTAFAIEASAPPVSSPSTVYQVGPENVLQIDVYYGRNEKISQKVRVSAGGIIQYPLVGEVEVAGLTVTEVQEKLRQLLAKDYLVNPQVTIFIEEYSTVSIVGEVRKPGVYPIRGRLTVVELIALAEGFNKIAAPNKVKVVRTRNDGTKEEKTINVRDIMKKNSNDQENMLLLSGDLVIVPESFL